MLQKLRRYLRWLILAFVLIIVWFIYSANQKTALKQKQKVYTVHPTSIRSTLSLSGKVDAEEKANLQFATSGKLTWVGVEEGDQVKKWQTLATLDQRELRKTLDKKLADFMVSRQDLDQLKDDYKNKETGIWNTYFTDEISRIVRESQYGVNKAVIDVELADLSLELSYLASPIDGIVTHIDQQIAGTNITPATARFQIVNPESLYLEATVDQQDVTKLKNDQRAEVVFDSFPEETYSSHLYYISFAPAEGEDSSYQVKFTVPSSLANKLRLGMAAEMELVTAEKKGVLAVPYNAISERGNKNYVTVKKTNNQTEEREVILGIESDTEIEVKKGLKRGEVVVY